jgi:hypothetical protein
LWETIVADVRNVRRWFWTHLVLRSDRAWLH